MLDAARDAGNRWIFRELGAEGLDPWPGTRYVFVQGAPEATHACDVTDTLEVGIASLRAHQAYLEHLGDDFDSDRSLRENAERVGQQLDCRYAVDFRVFRV